jgi:hypothetical protein
MPYRNPRSAAAKKSHAKAVAKWMAKPGKRAQHNKDVRRWFKTKGVGYDRQKRYGITQEQYLARLAKQGGVCALCRKKPSGKRRKSFCVDHDHACCPQNAKSCGECVRGLLCGFCNNMLGRFDDNPAGFFRVIAYLLEARNGGRGPV